MRKTNCQVLEYVNNEVPFAVKKRVLDAALMSSLVYGCESLLGAYLKPVTKLYNWCVKQLLEVRRSTSYSICYVESGYPSLKDLVKEKQHNVFDGIWGHRLELDDDRLTLVVKMVRDTNTPAGRLIKFLSSAVPTDDNIMNTLRDKLLNEHST